MTYAEESATSSGKTVVRSAKSGKFVTKVYAKRHPSTTVTEGETSGAERSKD